MDILIYIAVIIVMLLGVAGTLLPILPGIPVIFLAAAGYGWYEGFNQVSGHYLGILAAVAILSVAVDYLGSLYGARFFGSTRYGSWGSVVGGVIGIFALGPVGILLGPWLGAVAGELLAGRETKEALRAGTGALVGMLSGMVVKLLLAVGMLISFIVVTLPFV